jgi:hypothetical protein
MADLARTSRVALAIPFVLVGLSAPQVAYPQQGSISGTFSVLWGDGQPGSGRTDLRYHLTDDLGFTYRLLAEPDVLETAGGMVPLNGQRVVVSGTFSQPTGALGLPPQPPSEIAIEVASLALDETFPVRSPHRVSGSVPWVTILCKFSDVSAEPKTPAHIEGLMGTTWPGLDFYWREVSYDNINIVGSIVVGWMTLPNPRSYYVYDIGGDGSIKFDFTRATNDCTALADPTVYFPTFSGIQMLFNDELDSYAWGGGRYLTLDGVGKSYSTTWYPPWGYNNQSVIAHEMGHGLGLPHSSGPYSATYDSEWDVMSDAWACGPNYDATYRCLGQHTISYHKNILGWIPTDKNLVVAPGTQATFELDRLGMPTGDGYWMATVPILGTANSYTVERREFVGFDKAVPGQSIIIHEVVPGRSRPANVVDPDDDGDPNDEGAIWLPGEKWTDPTGNTHVVLHTYEMFVGDAHPLDPPLLGFGVGLGLGLGPGAGSLSGMPMSMPGGAGPTPRYLVTIVNGS